jgi:hypothetical protein
MLLLTGTVEGEVVLRPEICVGIGVLVLSTTVDYHSILSRQISFDVVQVMAP